MEFFFNCSLNVNYRRIRDIIVQCKGSLVLELQQRSIEFNSIIGKHQNIRYAFESGNILYHSVLDVFSPEICHM